MHEKRTEYLIIGNGAAGTTAAENIRKTDPDGHITIVTDEDLPFYSRIRLNEYICGDIGEQDLLVKKDRWYREMNIGLVLGTRITGADPAEKVMITGDDKRLSYDYLLIATGSHSFIPPITGSEKAGAFSLRHIRDARDIISYAKDEDKAVMIGGGLLGLETGNALLKLGKQVTVVEFFPRLLPRQLDQEGAKRLQTLMEGMGFTFRLGARTGELEGDHRVNSVRLEGGERLPAGMVIISAGVRPNLELAEVLDLDRDIGIQVNDHLLTSRPEIYAAGDVAEYGGIPYGIWPAAMEQGEIAGVNMAGGDRVYKGTTMANTLKVVGIDLASAGDIDAEGVQESIVHTDATVYRKIVLKDNRITGCIMLGDTRGFRRITRAMAAKKDVAGVKDRILEPGFDNLF